MKKTEVDYKILEDQYAGGLQQLVQHHIDDGWDVQGGVSATAVFWRTETIYRFFQAMTRTIVLEKGDD